MSQINPFDMKVLSETGLLRLTFMKCLIADTIADFFISKKLPIYGDCIIYGRITKDSSSMTIYAPKDKNAKEKDKVFVEQNELAKELCVILSTLNISDYLKLGHFNITCEKSSPGVSFYNYYIEFVTDKIKLDMWKNSQNMQDTRYKNHTADFSDAYKKQIKDLDLKEYASFKFPKKNAYYVLYDKDLKPAIAAVTLEGSGATSFTCPDGFAPKYVQELKIPNPQFPLLTTK